MDEHTISRKAIIHDFLVSKGISEREMGDSEYTAISIPVSCGIVPFINIKTPFDQQPAMVWQYKRLKEMGYTVYNLLTELPPIVGGELQMLLNNSIKSRNDIDKRNQSVLDEIKKSINKETSDNTFVAEIGDEVNPLAFGIGKETQPTEVELSNEEKKELYRKQVLRNGHQDGFEYIKQQIYNERKHTKDEQDLHSTSRDVVFKNIYNFYDDLHLTENQKNAIVMGLQVNYNEEQLDTIDSKIENHTRSLISDYNDSNRMFNEHQEHALNVEVVDKKYHSQVNRQFGINIPTEDSSLEEGEHKVNNIISGLRGRK